MTKFFYAVILLMSGLFCRAAAQEAIPVISLPELPVAISNNAAALQQTEKGVRLFSFKGIGKGKSWQDTTLSAFTLSPGDRKWHKISSVPGGPGELAATAITLGSRIYVFGGYSVARDGAEETIARSYEYDPEEDRYSLMPAIPVAVDDSVSFAIAGRYIYLISGWHNSGNVNLSQVYDTQDRKWFQATPYPGKAVFGHAGAAVGNRFVICDGVEKIVPLRGRHKYQATGDCFRGAVDPAKPRLIKWQRIKPHPGRPRYRMAAGGYHGQGDWIVFAGGSDNPYNYNAIGYDGNPSSPSDIVMAYSLDKDQWQTVGRTGFASMDHRRLLVAGPRFFIVGGMEKGQKVTNRVEEFCLGDDSGPLLACNKK